MLFKQTIPPTTDGVSLRRDILPMFRGWCDACHGMEVGRFMPTTNEGVLSMVVPGEPERSMIVQMMNESHYVPGLSPDHLAIVIEWIVMGVRDHCLREN